MSAPTSQPKPKGWLIGVGVLCITLAVIAGLIAIAVVAKRKQRYRITEPSASLTPPRLSPQSPMPLPPAS